MLSVLPYMVIIFAALGGLALAFYISHKKRAREVLVCPLKADCETVVHSDFAKFFGVPVELLGMAYYSLVALVYAIFIVVPAVAVLPIVFVMLVISTAAFLFSVYLTFIQAFAIKQWCTWCLISASLSTLIFALVATSSTFGLLPLLERNAEALVAIHLLGLALGLGGATITDIFFFRFLRDGRISHFESQVMRAMSQVIWLGLAVLIVSGLGLYLPRMMELNSSTKFLVKVTVVAVILINGAILNLIVSPRMMSISFGETHRHGMGELRRFRRLAFALGAVSATSWYTAFVLGILRAVSLTYGQLLLLYLVVVGAAVGMSQFVERHLHRRAG